MSTVLTVTITDPDTGERHFRRQSFATLSEAVWTEQREHDGHARMNDGTVLHTMIDTERPAGIGPICASKL